MKKAIFDIQFKESKCFFYFRLLEEDQTLFHDSNFLEIKFMKLKETTFEN